MVDEGYCTYWPCAQKIIVFAMSLQCNDECDDDEVQLKPLCFADLVVEESQPTLWTLFG